MKVAAGKCCLTVKSESASPPLAAQKVFQRFETQTIEVDQMTSLSARVHPNVEHGGEDEESVGGDGRIAKLGRPGPAYGQPVVTLPCGRREGMSTARKGVRADSRRLRAACLEAQDLPGPVEDHQDGFLRQPKDRLDKDDKHERTYESVLHGELQSHQTVPSGMQG